MISFLRGTVIEVLPMRLIIEAGGVSYDVHIPLSTYDKLPQPGAEAKILTHLVVREDAHILNGITPVIFRGLVVAGDIASLSKIKGVGKKTAERIIVELRDKVGVSAAWEAASAQQGLSPEEQHLNDAVLALISLGYKQAEAHKTVKAIRDVRPKSTLEELVKEALKTL